MNTLSPRGLDHCVPLRPGLMLFGGFGNLSLLVLFQWSLSLSLFFSFTVQHECNEVLPSFGIGVSGAKLTHWEISVFSCRQSIYLPSNVECVHGMSGERGGKMDDGEWVEFVIPVCSCSLWQMILSEGLHNSSWAIRRPWGIQSHQHRGSFRAYFNKYAINVKTSTEKWHVFHFHTWKILRYRFYSPSLMNLILLPVRELVLI